MGHWNRFFLQNSLLMSLFVWLLFIAIYTPPSSPPHHRSALLTSPFPYLTISRTRHPFCFTAITTTIHYRFALFCFLFLFSFQFNRMRCALFSGWLEFVAFASILFSSLPFIQAYKKCIQLDILAWIFCFFRLFCIRSRSTPTVGWLCAVWIMFCIYTDLIEKKGAEFSFHIALFPLYLFLVWRLFARSLGVSQSIMKNDALACKKASKSC